VLLDAFAQQINFSTDKGVGHHLLKKPTFINRACVTILASLDTAFLESWYKKEC